MFLDHQPPNEYELLDEAPVVSYYNGITLASSDHAY